MGATVFVRSARFGSAGPLTAPPSGNEIPARSNAARMASAFWGTGVRRPRSKSATVDVAMLALVARSCWDHARSARAARAWAGVRSGVGAELGFFMSYYLYDILFQRASLGHEEINALIPITE